MKTLQSALMLCLLLPCLSFANPLCSAPLKVASEPWPPYLIPTADGFIGLDADVLLAVFNKMGCEITWVDMPWARSLVSAGNGDIDIVTGASTTPERGERFYFSLPYRHEKIELFVRKNEERKYPFSRWLDIEESDFKLGMIKGAVYPDLFDGAMDSPKFAFRIHYVTTDTQMIKMLVYGHLDGFISEKEPVFALANDLGLGDKIGTYSPLSNKGKLHYLFSKRSVPKEFVDEFNRIFSELQNQGVLKEWDED